MEERAVIRRVLEGDDQAFAQLVTAYEKQVFNLCLRMCGNREEAKDLAQEAFLKAWRGLRFYQFEAAFSAWLYRLTSNVCIDYLRREKRRPTVSLTLEDDNQETPEMEIADSAPLPEEQVLHREREELVAWAMNQLDEEFRQVLTLRVIENLSYEEIGQIMELKEGTVKSRLARARLKLKKILWESGNNLEVLSSDSVERGREHDV